MYVFICHCDFSWFVVYFYPSVAVEMNVEILDTLDIVLVSVT